MAASLKQFVHRLQQPLIELIVFFIGTFAVVTLGLYTVSHIGSLAIDFSDQLPLSEYWLIDIFYLLNLLETNLFFFAFRICLITLNVSATIAALIKFLKLSEWMSSAGLSSGPYLCWGCVYTFLTGWYGMNTLTGKFLPALFLSLLPTMVLYLKVTHFIFELVPDYTQVLRWLIPVRDSMASPQKTGVLEQWRHGVAAWTAKLRAPFQKPMNKLRISSALPRLNLLAYLLRIGDEILMAMGNRGELLREIFKTGRIWLGDAWNVLARLAIMFAIATTAYAMGLMLLGAIWSGYVETPVGQVFVAEFEARASLITDILSTDFIALSLHLNWVALKIILIVGCACRFLHITKRLWDHIGFIPRTLLWGGGSTILCTWFILDHSFFDFKIALGLAAPPCLFLHNVGINAATVILPELGMLAAPRLWRRYIFGLVTGRMEG